MRKIGFVYPISHEELNELKSIKPISIHFEDTLDVSKREKLSPNITSESIENISEYRANLKAKLRKYLVDSNKPNLKGVAGVYVWTNLKTGDQNIGSSIDLNTRLKHYFKPSIFYRGNRLINQSMREYGLSSFRLDIYIIDLSNVQKEKISCLVLFLEQYYIFTLNSSLNALKVAGSNPIPKFDFSHIENIKKANSKKVYLYKQNTLVYISTSAVQLSKDLNVSLSLINDSVKNRAEKIYKIFNVSHKSPSCFSVQRQIDLLDLQIIKDLISENRQANSISKKKVSVTLMNHITKDTHTFSNCAGATRFLARNGLSLSPKTFIKYRDTGKIYNNWSFNTNK